MVPLKRYNTQQLAVLYEITYKVMKVWIDEIKDLGPQKGKNWNINQVRRIFDFHGWPEIDLLNLKPNQK